MAILTTLLTIALLRDQGHLRRGAPDRLQSHARRRDTRHGHLLPAGTYIYEARIYTQSHTYTYAYVCVYVYVICICVRMHTCVCVCLCVCLCALPPRPPPFFLQFEDRCGASFVMMTLMRGGMESADAVPPIFFDDITIDETSQARLATRPFTHLALDTLCPSHTCPLTTT